MKFRHLIAASIFVSIAHHSSAALASGDISIIGFRSDADDAIAFVTWSAIAAGESIHFTDSGFFDDGTLRDSENIMSWTAPAGGLAIGTVVVITSPNGSSSATVGTTTGQLDGISSSGDQVFAGMLAFPTANDTSKPGSAYAGDLLFGINFDGTSWASNSTSTNTSALPSSLTSATSNLALPEIDNSQYTGPRTGLTIAQYKSAIVNPSNWSGNDDGAAFGSLNSASFTVIPEPASAVLGSLGLLGLLRRRRSH